MQWRALSIPWTSGFCLVTVIYHIDTSVVTGKYRQKGTTRKIHTKLHLGPEWRAFHILTRGLLRYFSRLFVQTVRLLNVYNKKENYTVV